MRKIATVAAACVALTLLLLILRAVYFPTYVVPTAGMEPTIRVGEYVTSRKTRRAWKHGDIVIHHAVDGVLYCQRVIGVPGDRIHFEKRQLFRNGKKVNEPFVSAVRVGEDPHRDSFPQGESMFGRNDLPGYQRMIQSIRNGEIIVSPGDYFVMGDNRDNSADSRFNGYVAKEQIVGIVIGVGLLPFRPL